MNLIAFRKSFRIFASIIGAEFGDSSAHDDDGLARAMASDLPPERRIRYLEESLAEAHRFMPHIDEHWEAMAKEANRRLYTRAAARDWLVKIMTSWQEELTRLQHGGSRPT